MNETVDIQSTKDIYAYSLESCRRQAEHFDKMDSKASTIAGFIGVIIVLGGVAKVTTSLTWDPYAHFASLQVLYSTFSAGLVLTLSASFGYCLATLKARRIVGPTTIEDMIKHYRSIPISDNQERQLLKDMIKTLKNTEESFRVSNLKKSNLLQCAVDFLSLSLVLGVSGYVTRMVFEWFNQGGVNK